MLTIYFSGTGNTKHIAELFSRKIAGGCFSIEEDVDFATKIQNHDTITFCYPIYWSRVPLIMRQFVGKHLAVLKGKKVVILVTQMIFSGDGARVFCDLFPAGHIEVMYAEHIFLPNNVNDLVLLGKKSDKRVRKQFGRVGAKLDKVCRDINNGIVKKRGFSSVGRLLGNIQGLIWQGKNTGSFEANANTWEHKIKGNVKIFDDCIICNACVKTCPMKNLQNEKGTIRTNNNCTVCYRCANMCPKQAIAISFSSKPKWQY
jgi:ferredoxin